MRRILWQAIWFYRRKLKGARSIRGLVLDVGSGNSPYPRADVLAERYLVDDSNRFGRRHVLLTAPAVACDAESLPFADNAFDYAVCSHLIEHVDHPDKVLGELSRVARAGYIECPDARYDKLDTPAYHRWFASLEDGTLVLRQKDEATFDPGVKQLIHETFYADASFWRLFWRHLERFFVMLEWEGEIRYRVEYLPLSDGRPGSSECSTFDDPEWVADHGFNVADDESGGSSTPRLREEPNGGNTFALRLKRSLWKSLRMITRPGRREIDLLEIVVCPSDHGPLGVGEEGLLVCETCSTSYPIVDDVPYLYRHGD